MVQEVNKAKGNLEKVEKELKQMSALNKVCRHLILDTYFALTLWGFLFIRLSKLRCSFVWPAGRSSGATSLFAASMFSNITCQTVVIMARSCSIMTRAS
jgi:hypothetical protein